jgi:hypothetical protein
MEKLKDSNFRNYIGYDKKVVPHKQPRFKHCCGMLAADGSDSSATPAKISVANVTTWGYVKTALALVGAFVVIKYAWGKIKH